MIKLTQEELKQTSGGTIKIEDQTFTNVNTGAQRVRTTYSVYNHKDEFVCTCLSLEEAQRACDRFCCSKDVLDLRPGASQE